MRVRSVVGLGSFLLALGAPAVALGAVVEVTPADDLPAAVAALAPGDELVLGGGEYSIAERFAIDVAGTAAMPIVIRAKDGERPVITRPDDAQNTINIEGAAYVTLRGIEVTGGSAGIAIGDSSFITIEDCEVHHVGDVAIAANRGGTMEGFVIRRNHIHDTSGTGEGMYLGCHDGSCEFFGAIVERNHVHDTRGPTVEQGDGIEIKQGSHDNIVRDNVVHDTNYPCLISYNVNGRGGPNVFERNLLWGCGDHGIQSEADVVIRNNIILSAASDGIRHNNHVGVDPQNIVVVHNTIIKAEGTAYRADGVAGSLVLANNALYALAGDAIRIGGDLNGVTVAGNAGVGSVQGPAAVLLVGSLASDFVAANANGGVPNDVFPRAGSILVEAGVGEHVTADDFNGTPRLGIADVGAYKFDPAGNPGWPLGDGFKDAPVSTGEGGGGATSATNGTGATAGSGPTGTGAGAGAGGASGTGGADGDGGSDGGCSCRTAPAGNERTVVLAGLVGLCAVLRRRRR